MELIHFCGFTEWSGQKVASQGNINGITSHLPTPQSWVVESGNQQTAHAEEMAPGCASCRPGITNTCPGSGKRLRWNQPLKLKVQADASSTFPNNEAENPRVPEWSGLERTLRISSFQPCHGQGQFHKDNRSLGWFWGILCCWVFLPACE